MPKNNTSPISPISPVAGYKAFFSNKAVITSLLRDFVTEKFVEDLDFSTLKLCPSSFITPEFEERDDFLVWKLNLVDDSCCYIFVLLELQGSQDRWIALSISTYTGLLWESLIRTGELRPGQKLPPVFPIVIYNGDSPWCCKIDTGDLFQKISPMLDAFHLTQKYFLLDIQRIPKERLNNARGLCALIFGIECARDEHELSAWIGKIRDSISKEDFELIKKEFGVWIAQLLAARGINVKPNLEIEDDG